MIKLKLKGNENKKKVENEIQSILEYMSKLGPGEEYDDCIESLEKLYELKRQMSWTYKLKEALPWVGLGVTAVSTIAVPVAMGTLAYRNSEEQGKLKNGDVWREAIQNQAKPQNPNITDKM